MPIPDQLISQSTDGVVMLRGYLSDSPRAAGSEGGYIRLYLDASLTCFCDILEKDKLYDEASAEAKGPLNESFVWVRRDAALLYSQVNASLLPPDEHHTESRKATLDVRAKYLEGLSPEALDCLVRFDTHASDVDSHTPVCFGG